MQAPSLPEPFQDISTGTAGMNIGLLTLCRYTKCSHTSNIWCSRQTHHCHVVIQPLCALRAVEERLNGWPCLSDPLVEGQRLFNVPCSSCVISALLVLHGTKGERGHGRLSGAGAAHCVGDYLASWTGSIKEE